MIQYFVGLTYPQGSDSDASSKKRRRVDTPSEDCNISMIEKLCRRIADEQYERTRAELSNMETRLIQRVDQSMDDRLQDLRKTFESRCQNLEGQMTDLRTEFKAKTQNLTDGTRELEEHCEAEIERIDEWMHQVSDDIDQRVDLEVEDRVLGIKIDLEEFVKDELSSTADTLKQRIAEASMYIDFKD